MCIQCQFTTQLFLKSFSKFMTTITYYLFENRRHDVVSPHKSKALME
jgi:hypothetical protein